MVKVQEHRITSKILISTRIGVHGLGSEINNFEVPEPGFQIKSNWVRERVTIFGPRFQDKGFGNNRWLGLLNRSSILDQRSSVPVTGHTLIIINMKSNAIIVPNSWYPKWGTIDR